MDTCFVCPLCRSKGFQPSVTGKGCTFCDGTEAGLCPWCGDVCGARCPQAKKKEA